MKKIVLGFAVCSALFLCSVSTVQAQAWEEQVKAQLDGFDKMLRNNGYTLAQTHHISTLDGSSSEKVRVSLTAGVDYQFLGVCDNDCTDLDLTLYEPGGDAVATDVELDDTPIILYTATRSGTYQIEITMVDCDISPCYYGFGFWSRGSGDEQQVGQPVTHRGELRKGDSQLDDGKYYDTYTFEASTGQQVTVDLTSSAFDTYLRLASPRGESEENDDYEGSTSQSQITRSIDENGTWAVRVTSYEGNETGSYVVTITLSGGGSSGGQVGGTTTHRGSLAQGDATLTAGEYYDTYTFQAQAGQHVVVDMTSNDFDTYVGIGSPSGENTENDDYEESMSRSLVELDVTESGTWSITATSYEEGETGSYVVTVTLSGSAGSTSGGTRFESGMLSKGDATLSSGEYVDTYTMEGRSGELVVIDLRSSQFDPYLIVQTPSGETSENDDHEGDASRSMLSLHLTESGTYSVAVTSYTEGETGSYDLQIRRGGTGTVASGPRVERGTLASGDESLRTGEFVDVYEFEGIPGQQASLDVSSSEFDTYLMLRGPGEISVENDDVSDAPGHSIIEFDLTEMGTYRVLVTSYEPGETGNYELSIDVGARSSVDARQRDVHTIEMGGSVSGRLESGDAVLELGEYRDLFVFNGSAGQNITLEMNSNEFDTFLGLIFPSEEHVDNDDHEGDTSKSRIDLILPETGRYRVLATSYERGLTGSYTISLSSSSTPTRLDTGPAPVSGAGRVYGIFAGISDYPGERNDLPFTADDARNVYQAMILGAGMQSNDGIVLVDSEATVGNIRNSFQQMGNRVGPDDLFIFFYSGHGGRQDRSEHQPTDPDGIDETLFLFDGAITDDEMSELFGYINGRISLIVLDACFSGGFSKDVISVPGRMGFFSSEEDVTSSVAAKFRAGGFLAQFIADAIGERLADADGDNQITSLELSQYIHDRYRLDVKSGGADDYVRTGGPQLGYQHLVVDRGSIGPSVVLFK